MQRNIETFSKDDPYCKISNGALTWQTRTLNNGGKKPEWNETFEITVKQGVTEQMVRIAVYDAEDIGKDRVIGEDEVELRSFISNNEGNVALNYGSKLNKFAGRVYWKATWIPNTNVGMKAELNLKKK